MDSAINKMENTTSEVINFETLVSKLNEHQKRLSVNPNYIKDGIVIGSNTISKLSKLKNKHIINVNLEIPKEFSKQLGAGEINRIGGVLKHAQNQTFIKHLKEVKPSNVKKLTKVANIAFIALDILESVIVDQKLKEILETVKNIDLKLDAQNRGKLKSALEQFKDLHLVSNPDIKQQKILLIQNELSYCDHLYTNIYDNKWNKYLDLNTKYNNSKIRNSNELKDIVKIGCSLPGALEPIIMCKVAQIKLYGMQDEYVLAQDKANSLNSFLIDKLNDYKDVFDGDSLDEKKASYKNVWFQKREKRFSKIKDELTEPNEKIEFLLNSTICYTLSIPVLIGPSKSMNIDEYTESKETSRSKFFWQKIIIWINTMFIKIRKSISNLFNN